MTKKKATAKAPRSSRAKSAGSTKPGAQRSRGRAPRPLNTKTSAPRPVANGDWRHVTLDRIRTLITLADPEIVEEVKWRKPTNSMRGVPVWSHTGIICTGESYRTAVKLTFARGASLPDPARLFNSSLAGNTRRAINLGEGNSIDESAFMALIRAAVALNSAVRARRSR